MHKNPYPGKFIALEGIEGSGKTTQAKLLTERFMAEDKRVLLTREPTDNLFFWKLARTIYTAESAVKRARDEITRAFESKEYKSAKKGAHKEKLSHLARFEKLAASVEPHTPQDVITLLQTVITLDRHDHILQSIIPALEKGINVISDRYFPSTPAYSTAEGFDWRPFWQMQYEILGQDFLTPDLIIFISIPPEIGLKRTMQKQGGKKEFHDSRERLERVNRAYQEILETPDIKNNTRIENFDGSGNIQSIANEIWNKIKSVIFEK